MKSAKKLKIVWNNPTIMIMANTTKCTSIKQWLLLPGWVNPNQPGDVQAMDELAQRW